MRLIQHDEIDPRVVLLSEEFEECGGIAFELLESEYLSLTKLTKWYKNDYLPNTKKENWQERLVTDGLIADDKATYVFAFLSQNWNRNTHVGIEKSDGFILVKVSKTIGNDE